MLEARGIGFGYGRSTPILAAGEVVAVTGPSGRGKSTLLYLLGLMLKPAAGQVIIEGHLRSSPVFARGSISVATRVSTGAG